MRVLIGWAEESSPNLGVAALARGSVDLLRSVDPAVEVEYLNYGQRRAEMPLGSLRSLVRARTSRPSAMMDWLGSFDLFWDTRSGDSFADIYGLPRHRTMSLVHEFAVQAGARAVMAPQTFGPFGSRQGRVLARRTLKRSDLVLARDSVSAEVSRKLGRRVDDTVTDLVFGVDQPIPATKRDVLFNVSGLLWRGNAHVDAEAYRRTVRAVIDSLLRDGRSVCLLAHVLDSPSPDNDVPAVTELCDEYDGRVTMFVPSSLDDARSAIAGADLVIGSRMHACLNALSTGTPAIALAYSRKFAPLMAALGWTHVVNADAPEAATTAAEWARSDQLSARARDAQQRAQEMLRGLVPRVENLA